MLLRYLTINLVSGWADRSHLIIPELDTKRLLCLLYDAFWRYFLDSPMLYGKLQLFSGSVDCPVQAMCVVISSYALLIRESLQEQAEKALLIIERINVFL